MARPLHVQTTLLPPEIIEATLRLGVVGAGDHVQVQIEVRDPATDVLLALWSNPHGSLEALHDVLSRAVAELEAMVREVLSPF